MRWYKNIHYIIVDFYAHIQYPIIKMYGRNNKGCLISQTIKRKKKSHFNGFFPATLDSKNMGIIKHRHKMDMYTQPSVQIQFYSTLNIDNIRKHSLCYSKKKSVKVSYLIKRYYEKQYIYTTEYYIATDEKKKTKTCTQI